MSLGRCALRQKALVFGLQRSPAAHSIASRSLGNFHGIVCFDELLLQRSICLVNCPTGNVKRARDERDAEGKRRITNGGCEKDALATWAHGHAKRFGCLRDFQLAWPVASSSVGGSPCEAAAASCSTLMRASAMAVSSAARAARFAAATESSRTARRCEAAAAACACDAARCSSDFSAVVSSSAASRVCNDARRSLIDASTVLLDASTARSGIETSRVGWVSTRVLDPIANAA